MTAFQQTITFFSVFLLTCEALVVPITLVRPGPNTYEVTGTADGSSDRVRVHQFNNGAERRDFEKISEFEPIRNFALGELTDLSIFDFTATFNYTVPAGEVHTLTLESVSDRRTYTFIHAFDLSPSGIDGGLIRLVDGGVGEKSFRVDISSTAAGAPIQCFIVAYIVDLEYLGRNFRIGHMVPGLHLLGSQYFYQPNQNANAVITRAVPFQVTGDIAYIQGTNYVPKATGGLVAIGGGIGSTNATLLFESGVGEDLQFSILVFGSVRVGGL